MPTYTYRCKKCSETIDVFHAISAKPRVACPACNARCVKTIGTGAGIIFKGSGFYETDYKKNDKKAVGSDGAKAEVKSDSKSETKTETKTESKTAKKAAATE